MRKYLKRFFNTIYISILMITVILLLGIQSIKDLLVSTFKTMPTFKKESKNTQNYIAKQNSN